MIRFASSLAAILITFVPRSRFGGGSPAVFVLIVGGLLGMLLVVMLVTYKLQPLQRRGGCQGASS